MDESKLILEEETDNILIILKDNRKIIKKIRNNITYFTIFVYLTTNLLLLFSTNFENIFLPIFFSSICMLPSFGLCIHIDRLQKVSKLIINNTHHKICFNDNLLKINKREEYDIETIKIIEATKHTKLTYDIKFAFLDKKIIVFENLLKKTVEILWQKFSKYLNVNYIIEK